MIIRQQLLTDLKRVLQGLEVDLLERSESDEVPEVGKTLRAEYDRAKKAERTAENYEDWRSGAITQTAAAWVLSCVFVRFLEDNRLIDPPKIAGLNERLQRARDEHELYFRAHPKENDRDYLISVFDRLARLTATEELFGEHNALRELPNWLSGDAAGELMRFFQKIDANSGTLIHDFTDPNWDTRFLGDLYQDLSEAARKKYALLQTPEFVEEFILDRTLEPALDEFGLEQELAPKQQPSLPGFESRDGLRSPFKMIDPACGSGHFLLGAFLRILDRWQRKEPGTNVRDLVQRSLDSVYGVDVNPFAVAIARFRLLLAAMRACGIERLADAPGFRLNLVCGDSLLHAPLAAGGKKYTAGQQELDFALASDPADSDECDHAYRSENLPELKRLLGGGQYHAVVANPPYIVPKDKQLNERYRLRFRSCHRKYSLAVPFLERIFRLAVAGGYTGQITANSFMKREFGKKLIESFFPSVDLTHVIDTSGAYIPGHGTPTVILFGRHRPPIRSTLRTVMGIRGEPTTPVEPSQGVVWSAIVAQVDDPGSQGEFVSVGDSLRELFHIHPWSIGGGGASELKEQLEEAASLKLEKLVECIGFSAILGEDEAFGSPVGTNRIRQLPRQLRRPIIEGDKVRDWSLDWEAEVLFPYNSDIELRNDQLIRDWFWPLRCVMSARADFSKLTYAECGRPFWEYHQIPVDRNRIPLSIVLAEVATHNHFVLDRGGKVFKQTAPVIKLPREATEDDHLALLGLLNSSTACFWMKQVCHNKGSAVDQHGARQRTAPFEDFFAFNATKIQQFPLPATRPVELARQLDQLSQNSAANSPRAAIARWQSEPGPELAKNQSLRQRLDDAFIVTTLIRGEMLLAQEDLDWECYRLYGLIEDDLTVRLLPDDEDRAVPPGNRAFEIVMARKIAAGELNTTWFDRHGMTPLTELPDPAYNQKYRDMVERRINVIEEDLQIALIEQPEYKRRWNWEPWESQKERALRDWLLNRLERYFDFDGRMKESDQQSAVSGQPEERRAERGSLIAESSLVSIGRLADIARQDAEFQQVGELYREDPAFDVQKLVEELVAAESVPLLPILRYKESGLRKRAEWEQTWELQRQEDRLSDQLSAISDRLDAISRRQSAVSKEQEVEQKTESQTLTAQVEQLTAELQKLTASISVPPKYTSADFIATGEARYWSLRGKLDVPKERWISFPHCEGPDGTLVIAWAGYDHLQQASAISAYYVRVQTEFGGTDDARLIPLLACLIELLPWLKQWHNEPDAAFDGMRMGDYFEGFVNEEARQLNKTLPEIKAWTPPKKVVKRQSGRGTKGKNES